MMGKMLWVGVLLCLAALYVSAEPAFAEIQGPGLEVDTEVWPTNLPPGGEGLIYLTVLNIGAANTSGVVTVTDTLPSGVTATDAGTQGEYAGDAPSHEPEDWECTGSHVVVCKNNLVNLPSLTGGGGTPDNASEVHDPRIELVVKVAPGSSGTSPNVVSAAGGGAPEAASASEPVTISDSQAPFGVANFDVWFSNPDGTIDTQAGSHPYAATFLLDFNQKGVVRSEGGEISHEIHASEQVRNIEVELPPGLVGDVHDIPQCPRELFENDQFKSCPADTQIGVVTPIFGQSSDPTEPVFNVAPPPGRPAEFGFTIAGNPTYLDSSVRTGGDDGITTNVFNVIQRNIQSNVVTLWSNPGDPSHTPWSGDYYGCKSAECQEELPTTKPLLTLPTACAGPQKLTVRMHPWFNESITSEESILTHDASGTPIGFTGCEQLAFSPKITAAPDTSRADTPTGLTVEVKPPVAGLGANEGVGSSDIQNTTVTLPEGLVINPGQASGLQACPPSDDALGTEAAASCPDASKVGVVSIETPLLGEKLEGDVYLLQSNPPELKLLVAASAEGVNLKLVGVVHLNEQTGQLTTKFEGTPQLPFTDFKLSFSGGAQAALDTPAQCGVRSADADFTPWSDPFIEDFLTSASFSLTEGPEGNPCPPLPLPFAPSLTAGATTDQAGGFTGFSLLLQRGDGQQRISGLQFKAPAGLTGELSKIPLCTNAQAEANACPEASKIGYTVVTSGPGPYPLLVPQPGRPEAPIYLTESYGGAPFGLSIVVPLSIGPFTLPTQRVRAKIEINPLTTQLTITTDELPQIIAGVPTDLRDVDAVIDRPEFMVNPTSCDPQEFSGTAVGTHPPGVGGPGASAAIGSHFQVGACRALRFEPGFSVSTQGRTSKARGASLTTKVSYPSVPQGTEANISLVKVELPKQLPSRLSTLQKACTAAQFDANPANCPAASKIGMALVHTPLLPVPLVGPAIFVSHGGEAFPSLTLVLQGDGVTVDLVGTTFINKKSVTSTTFKAVPDQPFSSFELTLPQGEYSALATNLPEKDHFDLCGQKLVMPTEMIGQNGLVFRQSTSIAITGCAKAKALTRAQKLVRALKACRKDRKASKRASCEKAARKSYGPSAKKKPRVSTKSQ
jgi:hypothetical protein